MEVLRYAAFSADPRGGNPAGVVLDATGAGDDEMLTVAADIGYSETAFLTPRGGGRFDVRYFSPRAEVPFCGHATIAAAVAHADRHGPGHLRFTTRAGLVEVTTTATDPANPAGTGDPAITTADLASAAATASADLATASPGGWVSATLVSVATRTEPLAAGDLADLLAALRWAPGDLDGRLPPRATFAGAWHPVLAAATRERLADLDYDLPALDDLMGRRGWTTVNLLWRESPAVFHARDPFPPGGVVEDPATGAAAAALGGYLREFDLVTPPATVTVHQGDDLGRPSLLTVGIPADPTTGISVTGTAVPIP